MVMLLAVASSVREKVGANIIVFTFPAGRTSNATPDVSGLELRSRFQKRTPKNLFGCQLLGHTTRPCIPS